MIAVDDRRLTDDRICERLHSPVSEVVTRSKSSSDAFLSIYKTQVSNTGRRILGGMCQGLFSGAFPRCNTGSCRFG